MSMIPTGPGGGGKPYKGDNPIVPTTKDLTIDKGTLITKPLVISAVEDLTPEVTVQTPLVQEILESLVGKVTLANATPETILEGYSAYVGRQLVEGNVDLSVAVDFKSMGFTKCAVSTATFNSAMSSNGEIFTHTLGETPKMFIVIADDALFNNVYDGNRLYAHIGVLILNTSSNRGYCVSTSAYKTNRDDMVYNGSQAYVAITADNSRTYIARTGAGGASYYVASGVTYTVIALA